jgi:phosphohistidine phosphatase
MKSVFITRHAKSSWKYNVQDIDRPLKESGVKDAYDIATRMKERSYCPELILSSPANRAIHTALIFSRILNYPTREITIASDIYSAHLNQLLQLIEETPNQFNSVMLFGHDPSVTSLVYELCGLEVEKVSTSGTLRIDFQGEDWKKITQEKGKLNFYLKPNREKKSV